MKKLFRLLIVLAAFCFVAACDTKKTNKRVVSNPPSPYGTTGGTTDSGTTTSSGGDTSGSTDAGGTDDGTTVSDPTCGAAGEGSQSIDYYRIPVIGIGGFNAGISWASTTINEQYIFLTDARFKVRVKAKTNPPRNYGDKYDPSFPECQFSDPYGALQVDISVRAAGSSNYFDRRTFTNVAVDKCSVIESMNVPATTEPLIVEVSNVKWDRCKEGWGSRTGCAFNHVWEKNCYEIELQFSTDHTKDFPQ